jgi:hypothetical protein
VCVFCLYEKLLKVVRIVNLGGHSLLAFNDDSLKDDLKKLNVSMSHDEASGNLLLYGGTKLEIEEAIKKIENLKFENYTQISIKHGEKFHHDHLLKLKKETGVRFHVKNNTL